LGTKRRTQCCYFKVIELIYDELAELQEAIRCPNAFIVEIANNVISKYQEKQIIIRRDEE
tara:strand:+ start:363 stop:542 length:180 start_codon:yes stop_codon:yes gene_type:complete